jgi:tubulin delta
VSKLQEHADAVIRFSNDALMRALLNNTSSSGGGRKSRELDMATMNDYIAQCLLDVMLPSSRSHYAAAYEGSKKLKGMFAPPSQQLQPFEPFDLVASVCPLPSNKFMEIWTTSGLPALRSGGANGKKQAPAQWGKLVEVLCRAVPRFELHPDAWRGGSDGGSSGGSCGGGRRTAGDHQEITTTTLAYQVTARGDDDGQLSAEPDFMRRTVANPLQRHFPAPEWNPFPYDYKVTPYQRKGRSLTVACNRSNVAVYLDSLSRKARRMYDSQAYLHWYRKYGAEAELFEESFETVQTIIDDYHTYSAH